MGWSGQGGSVWIGRGGGPSVMATRLGGCFWRERGVGVIDILFSFIFNGKNSRYEFF